MGGDDFDTLKARVCLSDHVKTKVKLTRNGADWFGCCPFHNEKTASFSVNDAKGFYHCFGCGAHGDILDWWQKQGGMSFQEARDRLKQEAGDAGARIAEGFTSERRSEPDDETRRKQAEARAIWRASKPIFDTIADEYLRGARCIQLPHLPDCLRFHSGLQPDPRQPQTFPAMIAGVTDGTGSLVAIQRTFLAPDGQSKAPIKGAKRSLGPIGLGAVRLASAATVLGVAEGVETGLSAMEIFRLPVWCVLGSNLSRLDLPRPVRNVVIFGDRGATGEAAAAKACQIYRSQGRKVVVRFPEVGDDFNDELKARRNGR